MSDYTRVYDLSAKDALPTGNPSKVVKGSELDDEYDAIATAIQSKVDNTATANLDMDTYTLLVDTISETTADNGVAIDGLTIKDGGLPGIIPSGTAMLFMQNAAPTGWTFSASNDDSVILNTDTEAEGGGTGGSWTISGVTVDSHVLTTAEIPSHSHSAGSLATGGSGSHWHYTGITFSYDVNHEHAYANEGYDVGGGSGKGADSTSAASGYRGKTDTESTHTHTISGSTASAGSGDGHSHGLTADGAWRPAYVKCITCTKD